jgi:hypothetical protein
MKYKIVESASVADLESEVNALIKKGWRPVGGVAGIAEGSYGEPLFFQAMVKEK